MFTHIKTSTLICNECITRYVLATLTIYFEHRLGPLLCPPAPNRFAENNQSKLIMQYDASCRSTIYDECSCPHWDARVHLVKKAIQRQI